MSVGQDKILKDEQRRADLRPYKRILPSPKSRQALRERGYTWVLSSNVSGVATRGDSLYIRFHNASVYEYPNQADRFEDLINASSKGRWVWENLRRTNVQYRKVSELPLDEDIDYSDEDIMIPAQMAREIEELVSLTIATMDVRTIPLLSLT